MRIVIALGGNALIDPSTDLDYDAQEQQVRETARRIAPVVAEHEVALVHGNGPQVGGMMAQQMRGTFTRPLDVLVAETQGQIGYILQRELQDAGIDVSTIVTQVAVDPGDTAFDEPSKPVGPFVDASTAEEKTGTYHELGSGDRPFRRVVPSPDPQDIREVAQIGRQLETTGAAIAVGGGGIPVTRDGDGVEAVIDKDRSSALLGREISADRLVLLTNVDRAYRDFDGEGGDPIDRMTVAEARDLAAEEEFGEGSMEPKVLAAAWFADETGNPAIIGSLDRVDTVLDGDGTEVVPG